MFTEDLNTFFSDFVSQASYNGSIFDVIFAERYEGINIDGQTIEAQAPAAMCKTSDLDTLNIAAGAQLVINGKTYNVLERQDGDSGVSVLILSHA